MIEGVRDYLVDWKIKEIRKKNGSLTDEDIKRIISFEPRVEKSPLKT